MSGRQMLRMLRRHERRHRRYEGARFDLTRGSWPDVVTVAAGQDGRARQSNRATTEVEAGGEQVALHLYDVEMDYDLDVRRGDVVTFSVSADPLLVGRGLTVVEVVTDEHQTSRVAVCMESRA